MITIVSGIPRSGTSLMMQMISAGGMPVLTDGQRSADANNPRGYYELESVKSLARNPEVISQAEGKVVKVISSLLTFLPVQHEYRVVFMRRPLEEVMKSQDRMMGRLGKDIPAAANESVAAAFEKHLKQIDQWMSQQPNIGVLYVDYASVLDDAQREAARIKDFLEYPLDVPSMLRQVEHSLHREKSAAVKA
ncbi:MAG TPA: sulfotransferase domain-containing protein [Candidatus Binatia bacterium]|nr:sulfotransferase domain-containing protein [Candidatus Binatia bacterium]